MSGTIEICGLTKRYGQLDALAGIDRNIGSGELFGYLGPNGAGKSTTIRASALGKDVHTNSLILLFILGALLFWIALHCVNKARD